MIKILIADDHSLIREGFKKVIANEIMATLSLSLSSVHTYSRRIMEKMSLQSNLEIIRYAMKNNLVD